MNESVDIEAVRDEALRKLGRNIVNFSKIEALFKDLLSVNQLEVTGKTISDQLPKKQTKLRKQTLGTSVQEFYKNILSDNSQFERTLDFSGAEISYSFKFKVTDSNSDFFKLQKRQLARIVVERNKLIHEQLAFFDTSSVEHCHNLITLLDEQNPRLLAQLEELSWMVELLRENLKRCENFFKSLDSLESIQSNQSNA